MKPSSLESMLLFQLRVLSLPEPVREYRFHATRRWRFDFAWPDRRLAAEVEGGAYTGGRHVRGAGFEADAEKYLMALLDGWRVLRFTGSMVKRGLAIRALEQLLKGGSDGRA